MASENSIAVQGGVTVLRPKAKGGRARVRLWDGTELAGPEWTGEDEYQELEALVADFEYLLNSATFFQMHYDPGSFSSAVMKWFQSEFEPAANCVAKRQLVSCEQEENGSFWLRLDKPDLPDDPEDVDAENQPVSPQPVDKHSATSP